MKIAQKVNLIKIGIFIGAYALAVFIIVYFAQFNINLEYYGFILLANIITCVILAAKAYQWVDQKHTQITQQNCQDVKFFTGFVWMTKYKWVTCDIGIDYIDFIPYTHPEVQAITDFPKIATWLSCQYLYKIHEFTRYFRNFRRSIIIALPCPFDDFFEFNEGRVLQDKCFVTVNVAPVHLRQIVDNLFVVTGNKYLLNKIIDTMLVENNNDQ